MQMSEFVDAAYRVKPGMVLQAIEIDEAHSRVKAVYRVVGWRAWRARLAACWRILTRPTPVRFEECELVDDFMGGERWH